MKTSRRTFVAGASAAAVLSVNRTAFAQKKYSEGASDTEIKIGHTNPYSGPASAYGTIGKVETAYFKKINEEGGVTGRSATGRRMTTRAVGGVTENVKLNKALWTLADTMAALKLDKATDAFVEAHEHAYL